MNNILTSFDSEKCCGCGSCIQTCPTHALSYANDSYGFIVPRIEESKCVNCGKCIRSCPYNNLASYNAKPMVYAAVSLNDELQLKSSSGGIMGEMAISVLREGGVVFGCEMTDDFSVRHTYVSTFDELPRIQRSKYLQSYQGQSYAQVKKFLADGRKVLYTGTPCIIAGLKSYLGKMAGHDNLITIDVVCHGVPSQAFFNDYLSFLSRQMKKPIQTYTFRAKRKIRNGMEWNVAYATLHGKQTFRNWPEDSYNYYYMKGATYRDSCYKCPFASSVRYSDVTLCDYWHWEESSLHFNKDDSVSGIVLNTAKGAELFENIKGRIRFEQSTFEDLSLHNSCLRTPTPQHPQREYLLDLWKKEGYGQLDKYFRKKYGFQIAKYRLLRHVPKSIIHYIHNHI